MYKISSKLRNLILAAEHWECFRNNSNIPIEIVLSVSSLSIEVISEIISWIGKAREISVMGVREYKVDVGPFLGIFPLNAEIKEDVDSLSGEVTFNIDCVNYDWFNSWKSWFIIEE